MHRLTPDTRARSHEQSEREIGIMDAACRPQRLFHLGPEIEWTGRAPGRSPDSGPCALTGRALRQSSLRGVERASLGLVVGRLTLPVPHISRLDLSMHNSYQFNILQSICQRLPKPDSSGLGHIGTGQGLICHSIRRSRKKQRAGKQWLP